MTPPVIYIDIKQSKRLWPLQRPQRYFWVALNAGNMRRMARSSETYTNRKDVLTAVEQLFALGATVYRREAEHGNELLRIAE